MFTVNDVNQLTRRCDAAVRVAVAVAFSARMAAEDPSQAPPLLLMRLTCSRATGVFGVVGHHLPIGDPVAVVSELTPEQCRWDSREDHLGALAATNLWAPGDDRARALRSDGARGRIIVGVTVSGWSLAIRDRWDDAVPACQVAEPSEFGKIGDELADALAILNSKFPQLGE